MAYAVTGISNSTCGGRVGSTLLLNDTDTEALSGKAPCPLACCAEISPQSTSRPEGGLQEELWKLSQDRFGAIREHTTRVSEERLHDRFRSSLCSGS